MSIGIYKITNLINGKSYIGQSVNIEKRMYTHFWAAYKENLPCYNYHIYQAIRKYGKDNFKAEILVTISEEEIKLLNDLERNFIKQYDSYHNGYNMNEGGNSANQNCHSGENNAKAKLTKQDVIAIRTAYNNHESKKDVYSRYSNRIGESGFHKIWTWATWKNVLPEYHSKENVEWYNHQGKALSSEQAALNAGKIDKITIYNIRELFESGIPPEQIVEILELKIQPEEVRKIGLRQKFSSIK